jgi:hypothetical protein
MGWKNGHYWQRRTRGRVADGFGKPAGEPHGPFRTAALARQDLMLEYQYGRRGEERLSK